MASFDTVYEHPTFGELNVTYQFSLVIEKQTHDYPGCEDFECSEAEVEDHPELNDAATAWFDYDELRAMADEEIKLMSSDRY